MPAARPALVVIDVQNDYFPGGSFPLWNTEATLERTLDVVRRAQQRGIPVIIVQHVADGAGAPFFHPGSDGAAVHPLLSAAAPEAPIVIKTRADSFYGTTLAETLQALAVSDLLLCGMMTQNCVTHTALSRAADGYGVSVLADCCTTVSEMLHNIALHALTTTRVALVSSAEVC